MKNLGSRKTTGSSGASSQAQADVSCPSFGYISGMYLNISQVLNVGGTPAKGGGNPQSISFPTSEIQPLQVTSQPSPNMVLS